jgi:hypothetical protein
VVKANGIESSKEWGALRRKRGAGSMVASCDEDDAVAVLRGGGSALLRSGVPVEQQEEAADAPRGPERGGLVQRFVDGRCGGRMALGVRRGAANARLRLRRRWLLLLLLLLPLRAGMKLTHDKAPSQ